MAVIYSNSPHVRSGNTTRKIMMRVVIALLPCLIMGIVYFGIKAFLIVLTSTFSAVLSEFIYLLVLKKKPSAIFAEMDGTSIVTGLIIGLILNVDIGYNLYIPALASCFAVIVVKMLFGGTGYNLVNPAACGRVFVFISFATLLDKYVLVPNISAIGSEVITQATTLKSLLADGTHLSNIDLLLGTGVQGTIGETCKIAIILGLLYLIFTKTVNYRWPIVFVLVEGLFAVVLEGFNFSYFIPSILSGGLMFAAVFMATDYTTSPATKVGCYIYYVALGIVTAILRKATGYEVVSFAILLMNLTVPLIDKYIIQRPFGYVKPKKGAK